MELDDGTSTQIETLPSLGDDVRIDSGEDITLTEDPLSPTTDPTDADGDLGQPVNDIPSTPPGGEIHGNLLSPLANCPPHPLFATERLGVDRRLIVNRKRQLKMYRVWMQGKFRKL